MSKKKRIIITVAAIVILTPIIIELLYVTTPKPKWVGVEFDIFSPSEGGYILFAKDGYMYLQDEGDKIKVRYKYNILTQTIFIGIYPYKVVYYDQGTKELRLKYFFGKDDVLSPNGSHRNVAHVSKIEKLINDYQRKHKKTPKQEPPPGGYKGA